MGDLYIAVVCSSNMNRSMEAHAFLAKKGFKVKSFGTGDKVKLPGSSADRPNCYDFGVPYDDIYNDLLEKDKSFYTQNGLLHMLDRNRRIKPSPEKFQTCNERFDVIVTCEERVYDQVIEWFGSRRSIFNQPVHVVNVDIQDNHEEATIGAFLISDMSTRNYYVSMFMNHNNDVKQLSIECMPHLKPYHTDVSFRVVTSMLDRQVTYNTMPSSYTNWHDALRFEATVQQLSSFMRANANIEGTLIQILMLTLGTLAELTTQVCFEFVRNSLYHNMGLLNEISKLPFQSELNISLFDSVSYL